MMGMVVGRRGPVLAAGVLILVAGFWSRPVQAFCRTTTCSPIPKSNCIPRECLEDDVSTDLECASDCPPPRCRAKDAQGCLSKGIPVYWPQGCLSFSVQSTGSAVLGLGY